jgi:hypothetical protein
MRMKVQCKNWISNLQRLKPILCIKTHILNLLTTVLKGNSCFLIRHFALGIGWNTRKSCKYLVFHTKFGLFTTCITGFATKKKS